MTFSFRPAVRDRTSLLIGIAGASGSGKTYSALEIATGLAGPGGKIAVIDTEAGRALHYADLFAFDHGDMMAPFGPGAYAEAIKAADGAGYDVIIVDSFSHEYEGEGGVLEWADRLAEQGVKTPGNWKEPKTAHKRMVGKLLQCRAHLIFCLRADEKMLMEQVPLLDKDGTPKIGRNGKPIVATHVVAAADRPVEERWQPICEKRFPYELTVSLLMLPSKPGVPLPLKLQRQHRAAFPDGERASRRSGEILRMWATGESADDKIASRGSGALAFDPEHPGAWLVEAQGAVERCETLETLSAVWKGLQSGLRALGSDGRAAALIKAKDQRKLALAEQQRDAIAFAREERAAKAEARAQTPPLEAT